MTHHIAIFQLIAGARTPVVLIALRAGSGRYRHAVWHVFALGGSTLRYSAVLDCVPAAA